MTSTRLAVFYFGRSATSPFDFSPDQENKHVDGGIRHPREISHDLFHYEERPEDVY